LWRAQKNPAGAALTFRTVGTLELNQNILGTND
jgi:hypothetical protein